MEDLIWMRDPEARGDSRIVITANECMDVINASIESGTPLAFRNNGYIRAAYKIFESRPPRKVRDALTTWSRGLMVTRDIVTAGEELFEHILTKNKDGIRAFFGGLCKNPPLFHDCKLYVEAVKACLQHTKNPNDFRKLSQLEVFVWWIYWDCDSKDLKLATKRAEQLIDAFQADRIMQEIEENEKQC